MPTRERLAKAGGDFEIGGDGSRRIVRMLDAPLEQMRAREQLTEQQYQILGKLRLHWFLGHQSGGLHAVDLNRMVLGVRKGGEPAGEVEILHREMFDTAFAALQALERDVTARVVIEEYSTTTAGALIGYRSPYRARQAVIECLRAVAMKIMAAWLAMDRT